MCDVQNVLQAMCEAHLWVRPVLAGVDCHTSQRLQGQCYWAKARVELASAPVTGVGPAVYLVGVFSTVRPGKAEPPPQSNTKRVQKPH